MKRFTQSFSKAIFALLALCMVPVIGEAQSRVLMQRYTNTSCGPCAAIAPTYKPFVERAQQDNRIVHVVYHMSWPSNQDPFYVNDPDLANAARAMYGVNSVPMAFYDGTQISNVGNATVLENELRAAENRVQNPPSFAITHEAIGSGRRKVTVNVTAGAALNNARLRVEILERFREFAAPSGEPNFVNIARAALPNFAGTPITLGAGQSRSFEFEYTVGATWIEGEDDIYPIAYIQDDATKRVFGAGQGEPLPLDGRLEISGLPDFTLIPGEGSIEREVTILNSSADRELEAKPEVTSQLPSGWSASFSPESATIAAGQSQTFRMTLTANDQAYLISVRVEPSAVGTGGLNIGSNRADMIVMSDNARHAVIAGGSNAIGAYYTPIINELPSIGKTTIVLPLNAQLLSLIDESQFELFVVPISLDGQGFLSVNATLVNLLDRAMRAGKSIFLATEVELFLSAADASRPGNVFFNNLGVRPSIADTVHRFRQSGNSLQILPFPLNGRANDPISAGFSATANQSQENYSLYTELIRTNTGAPVTPMLFYDNAPGRVAGIRYEQGRTKVVFISFRMEAIPAQPRNDFYKKAIEWLMDKPAAPPQLAFDEFFIDMRAEVTKTSTLDVRVRNRGGEDLILEGYDFLDNTDGAFGVASTFPMTIAPGASANIVLTFSPTQEKTYGAELEILSNSADNAESFLFIDGRGEPLSAPGPVISLADNRLDFGDLDLDESPSRQRSLALTNTGAGTLVINSINIAGAGASAFSFAGGAFPIEVEEGQMMMLPFTFAPADRGTFEATVTFNSNADNSAVSFVLEGKADKEVSVGESIVRGKALTASVAPNPIMNEGTLRFSTVDAGHVRITLLNAAGATVRELTNAQYAAGTHNLHLTSFGLAAGMYHALISTGKETIMVPVVITK